MKRFFPLLVPGFFILATLIVSGCQKKSETDPLVVAMELQFPPFEMTAADGSPTGISVDMAQALGEYLGRPVKIENTAWVGLIPALQSGKADLVISSMSITDERAKVIDFSQPYAFSGLSLLIFEESPVVSYQDLAQEGVVVAVKSGTTGAIWAQANLPAANFKIYDEVSVCGLEVSQGKADAFIYDPLTVFALQQKFPEVTRVNLVNLPGTVGGWGVAMKKGQPELMEQVNAFIREYRASGGFKELEKQYLTEFSAALDTAKLPSFFDEQ